jgi:hypothetical protein
MLNVWIQYWKNCLHVLTKEIFLCVILFLSVISDQHFHIVCGIFCADYNINILNLASAKNIKDVEKQLHYDIDALSTSFAILIAVVLSLVTRYWYICTDFTLCLFGTYDHVGLYICCVQNILLSVHMHHNLDFTCINIGWDVGNVWWFTVSVRGMY